MTSPTLRLAPALVLCACIAVAAAQATPGAPAGAGLELGARATIDGAVVGAPELDAPSVAVIARGEGGDELAVLDLLAGSRPQDGPHLRGSLPDLRGHPALLPVDAPALWPCALTATAPGRMLPVGLWAAADQAVLELANGPLPAEPVAGYRQFVLVFADTDVRIHGHCPDPAVGLTVDAYLRPGWNVLASESIAVAGGLGVLLRTAKPADLADAAWHWRDLAAQGRGAEVTPSRP